jgi:hypothetical protein
MAVVELAIGGAGRTRPITLVNVAPHAARDQFTVARAVITHAMLPLGEAKCVNSTSTGTTGIDVSGAACATFLLGPMGCDCSVAGAEPSDRLSEGLPHPPSAITATTSKTSAAIIRASTHLPHDADGIAIDVLSRSAMGLTPHHGGNRRHPRTLGSFRTDASDLVRSAATQCGGNGVPTFGCSSSRTHGAADGANQLTRRKSAQQLVNHPVEPSQLGVSGAHSTTDTDRF